MIKHAALFLMLLLSAGSMAGVLPANVQLTPENANQYSISVEKISSGDPEVLLYQVLFSEKLNGCAAGRVQTALYAGSRELSSSSMDYPINSNAPSLLVHFPAKNHDMAVSIQYCCTSGLAPGCQNSLSINSLRVFHNAARGS